MPPSYGDVGRLSKKELNKRSMLERQPTLVSSLSLPSPYGSLADSRPARKCLGSVEEVSRKCL